jgi:hypothetical protein
MKNTNIRKIYYHIRYRYITMNNVVITIVLLVGLGWAWASIGVMQRNYDLQKEVDGKMRQQKLLDLENQALAYEQKYYQTREYQELAIRDRLGLASPGEKVLLLPPNSQAAEKMSQTATAPSAQTLEKPVDNMQQWVNFLFGGNHNKLEVD